VPVSFTLCGILSRKIETERRISLGRTIIVCLCLINVIIPARLANAQEQVLRLATIEDFKPFVWKENNRAAGIDSDIVSEMARRAGIGTEIKFVPWKRAMHMTKKGTADGAFTAFKTPERESFAHYLSYPIHFSTYSLFVVKGHEFLFQSVEDLYEKEIGINSGFSLGKKFEEAKKNGKILVQEAKTTEQNIKKLLIGRFEAYIGNLHATLYALKTMGLSGRIVYLPHPVQKPRGAYLIISKTAEIKNKEELIRRLDDALKKMKEDGTIENIHSKYLD